MDALAELTAAAGAELCLMHMQNPPNQPPSPPRYDDIVAEVKSFLEERMAFAVAHGVPEQKIILDPGFGGGSFGKDVAQNLELLRRLPELVACRGVQEQQPPLDLSVASREVRAGVQGRLPHRKLHQYPHFPHLHGATF